MSRRIRVMIVADHPIMLDGLRLAFARETDMQVVCEATDVFQVVQDFTFCQPDVTIIDLQLPHGEGLRAVRRLRKIAAAAPIVVLTTYPGEAAAVSQMGPLFEISKTASSAEIMVIARTAASAAAP